MKVFLLAVVFVVATLMASTTPGHAQDVGEISKKLGVVALELKAFELRIEKSQIEDKAAYFTFGRKEMDLLVAKGDGTQEVRESLKKFLELTKGVSSFMPEFYTKEIRPVMMSVFQRESLPKKPTVIQQRLIKAGGEKLDVGQMAKEALVVIQEETDHLKDKVDRLNKQLKAIQTAIAELEKEKK
ncbi:MAG: hypothetical protein EXS52_01665 [Candidatus Staskawiczbacteria bacterium]|nr:hypothetical protein [Candidatus Staskawiczbacteria bacterium]